tara:strand:- start:352 stop:675 length:324 start_codon:yes stop_codon:yes gene_type:complete
MGYRSSGAIWISQDGYEQLTDEMRQFLANEEVIDSFTHIHRENIDGIIFEYEGWKFYDSYPDVKMYREIFALIDEDNYDFVRIGESQQDIEHATGNKFVVSTDYEVI